MKKTFIKKHWEEENITFCIFFVGEYAVKQIEFHADKVLLTSEEKVFHGESMLYDQKLSELDLNLEDYISEEDFFILWNKNI